MDSATVVRVLYGDLPDDEHEAVMANFWEACPRLAPMRDVVSEVVTYRREAASRYDRRMAEMRARYDRERDLNWAWLKSVSGMTVDEIKEMADASSARTDSLLQAEIAEMVHAMHENAADVFRCMRLLYWRAERETMAVRARCA